MSASATRARLEPKGGIEYPSVNRRHVSHRWRYKQPICMGPPSVNDAVDGEESL